MPSPSKEIVRTWLRIMVISTLTVNVLGLSGEKRFDLRIGFDLTQGDNGSPSLRIRDFEDSAEFVQRAHDDDDDTKEVIQTVKDSNESGEAVAANPSENIKPDSSKESSGKSDEENEYSEEEKFSTRGLKAADYEAEENAEGIHVKHHASDDESDKRRYQRRKRNAFFN